MLIQIGPSENRTRVSAMRMPRLIYPVTPGGDTGNRTRTSAMRMLRNTILLYPRKK